MVAQLQLINAGKTIYYVDQITPVFHVLTTLLMTCILMYWGSILLMAPGIVFQQEVFVTRLAEIFQIKNVFVICLLAVTWGHYPCRMAERYIKKEMMSFWICSFLGVYGGLWIQNYLQFWEVVSGGGYIDIYPLEATSFFIKAIAFILIGPILACQCTYMSIQGTLRQFFSSTGLLLGWMSFVSHICTPAGGPGPDYFSITMYWIIFCFVSAPGQLLACIQGFVYGLVVSRFLCVAPLALFPGGESGDFFQQIPGVFGRAGKSTEAF